MALILFALFLTPALALSSTPTGGQTGNTKDGLSASDVTATAKLVVRRVENDPNRVYLFDPEREETHVLVISDKTKLTARRKKDFDGRRKLEFDDLEQGQTLKITYRLDDGHITGIQVVEVAS
jgi:hypothetical protein